MDKFTRHREDLAAESRLHQPVSAATTADGDFSNSMAKEEDDLQVTKTDASDKTPSYGHREVSYESF